MKKKLSILTIFALISTYCVAQLPTVVSAPIAEANLATANTSLAQQTGIMTTMNGVIASLEKADQIYKDALKQATWLQDLQTSGRILFMIENLICTSKNLSVRMRIGGSSCLYSYRYDLMLIKVQESADFMTLILASGIAMSAAERMNSLDNVIESFKASQEMMVKLNSSLDKDLKRMRIAKSSSSTLKSLYAINRGQGAR